MASEQRFLRVAFDDGNPLDGGEVGGHEGEGLLRTMLAFAERGDGLFVRGVAGEVEAADALDGDDFAIDEGLAGGRDSIRAT